MDDDLPPATAKSAKTSSSTLAGGASSSSSSSSSLTDMSNVALRHTFRFADARKLAAAECLAPRVAQVARAAVVEAADKRHGVALKPVSGCAWLLLVQEGQLGCEMRCIDRWSRDQLYGNFRLIIF